MLEEINMDKKSMNRSLQPPGKGPGTEAKKNQDATYNKPFARSFRQREFVNASPKYEPSKKPVAQKNKSYDRRPRPRGQNYGCRKEDSEVAEAEYAEYGSLLVPGSKKQNLNHLLNFHFAPREGVSRWQSSNLSHGRQNSNRLLITYKHKYNKEQFLQANCQFVVKADGDYTAYTSDPDALVDWDLIEQVRLQVLEEFSCPICLYPPVAAKITRCGHVFCWSCILHYLSLSDKTWRKCPICYDAVHRQDLKSVTGVSHSSFPVGGYITMRLMKRERGSLVVVPVNQQVIPPAEKLLSVSEKSVETAYAKLLMADYKEVLTIVEQEKTALEVQLAEDQGAPEMCFIEEALVLLKERENLLLSKMRAFTSQPDLQTIPPLVIPDEDSCTSGVDCSSYSTAKRVVYSSAFDDEVIDCEEVTAADSFCSTMDVDDGFDDTSLHSSPEQESFLNSDMLDSSAITAEDLEIPNDAVQVSSTGGVHAPKIFYFYQASDGQHIYLHSINVRMLEHQYGSLSSCPHTIAGHIVEKESGSMTEDLRRRLRYLEHLPITSQFEVAEILLEPPVLTKHTLDYFRDQLDARKRRRQRRDRDERRREKWITEEENRRWGKYPIPKIRINSHQHFPQCGSESPPGPQILPTSNSESSLASSDSHSLGSISSITAATEMLDLGNQTAEDVPGMHPVGSPEMSGRSFAQMLREGKSKGPVAWSSLARQTNNSQALDVPEQRTRRYSNSDPEPEGYIPAPTFKQSFGDAISMAIEKAVAAREGEDGVSQCVGKKKKKQKQKVLFATSMACPLSK